jgi:hypothetical protein
MKTMIAIFGTLVLSSPALASCDSFDKMVANFLDEQESHGYTCEQKPNPKPPRGYPEDQVDLYICTRFNGVKQKVYAYGHIVPRPNGERCIIGKDITMTYLN